MGAVRELYQQMDASLRFTKPTCATQPPKTIPKTPPTQMLVDLERDFRGVVCPLNYVKTRMALEKLKPGQVLAVLLDDDGARNVPESAAKEGHDVRSISQVENHWRVEIRKAGA